MNTHSALLTIGMVAKRVGDLHELFLRTRGGCRNRGFGHRAALAMSVSSVCVVSNALRLKTAQSQGFVCAPCDPPSGGWKPG